MRQRIGELARLFPDLTGPLAAISERLFDLLRVIRAHYYHPAFHGSYSIKTVLPVLVPDMTYEGMAVGDGGAAVARFARMALGGATVRNGRRPAETCWPTADRTRWRWFGFTRG